MKEVRYNDKFWFGKHKGARISDIIKHDPSFIQKVVREGKIKLDSKSKTFFEQKYGTTPEGERIRREPAFGRPQAAPPIGIEIADQNRDFVIGTILNPNFTEQQVRDTLSLMVNELAKNFRQDLGSFENIEMLLFYKLMNNIGRERNRYNLRLVAKRSLFAREDFRIETPEDITLHLRDENNHLMHIYDIR